MGKMKLAREGKIPSLLGQVTLGKSHNFSEPHFLSRKVGL